MISQAVTHKSSIPIKNIYKRKQTLNMDVKMQGREWILLAQKQIKTKNTWWATSQQINSTLLFASKHGYISQSND